MELVCLLARLVGIPLTPMLSRTEVVKCAVTHYFKVQPGCMKLCLSFALGVGAYVCL